jgi:hypothetical protein
MASPSLGSGGASRDGGAIILDGVSVQYRSAASQPAPDPEPLSLAV